MKFYIGLHQPSDARHFENVFVSVNRLRTRKKPLGCASWIMDSGAFTELSTHARYRHDVAEYAGIVNRWQGSGLIAAVAQDYMCEPWIVEKTGLSVAEHQRLTIDRYDALRALSGVYIMPVLQGYAVSDYLDHLGQYGDRLTHGAYVGVGSVCKRNTKVGVIEDILVSIKRRRPDLRLHGFGLKITSLFSGIVRASMHSADSMAWSFDARRKGGNANDWRAAAKFVHRVETQQFQYGLNL
jgi:hypothetical protein